jgi:xanthine dehydrogenase YagS FAD-binding subunit
VNTFSYVRAEDPADAVALAVADPEAVFLAGGTNLVDRMKLGVSRPSTVIDVSRLALDDVRVLPDGSVWIGATVRNADLAAHPLVRQSYPVLSQALLSGASGQLRNMATTGGNLLQRTRCVYFADVTLPCNKREPGSGCPARNGYSRYHAIFGASAACVAVHPSDQAVAMAALDAVVVVLGPAGERRIRLVDLHRLPGDRPEQDTVLGPSDLVIAVELPPMSGQAVSGYRKVRDRASFAFALVSVAAVLELADGSAAAGEPLISDVRIALGGVAHKPWRARAAEEILRAAPATPNTFRRAAEAELAAAEPLEGNAGKVILVRNALTALMGELTERAVGRVAAAGHQDGPS